MLTSAHEPRRDNRTIHLLTSWKTSSFQKPFQTIAQNNMSLQSLDEKASEASELSLPGSSIVILREKGTGKSLSAKVGSFNQLTNPCTSVFCPI
jgi:transcriptional regulator with AAA-type ATPase domain